MLSEETSIPLKSISSIKLANYEAEPEKCSWTFHVPLCIAVNLLVHPNKRTLKYFQSH